MIMYRYIMIMIIIMIIMIIIIKIILIMIYHNDYGLNFKVNRLKLLIQRLHSHWAWPLPITNYY